MDKIIELEQRLNVNVDLLEVAKSYCDLNSDKSTEMSSLSSVLDIVLKNQKDIAKNLDFLYNK